MAARTRAAPYGARKGGPIAVGKLLMTGFAERELETVCPPGSRGATSNTARGTPGSPVFCGKLLPVHFYHSCTGPWGAGAPRCPARPRLSDGAEAEEEDRRTRRLTKKHGR